MTKTLAIFAALCLPTPALQAAAPNAETRSPTQAAVRSISDERVEFAIDAAVEFLFSQQGNSGRWRTEDIATAYPRAQTALAAFALTVAGASPNDPRMQKAIRKLDDRERVTSVWARAMTLRLFCRLDPRRYKRAIEDDVHFLLVQQDKSGNWGEGVLRKGGRGKAWRDHANSALALRALADAEAVGAEVRATAWRRAEDAWIARQNPDGGWGYSASDDPRFADESQESTVEMTAAGLASLRLIYHQLYLTAERPFNGRFKGLCGQEVAKTKPIRTAVERATNWLDEHALFAEPIATAHGPRGDVGAEWETYTLAQIAQFAAQAGLLRIGEQAWFPAIARRLIDTQHEDGSWGTIEQTCYALLALLHGRTPIVVGKLAYGGREDWNNDPHDAAGLLRFFQLRTGRAAGWQIVSLDRIADEVFRAPVLYLTGHGPPQLTEENRETLREFVWSGGTIMAAACCSKKEFAEGSAALFEEMFPRLVRSVPPDDHPIWSTPDPIQPKDDVIGFSDGCRTRIFVLTGGACCAWHQDIADTESRLFSLGGNILNYALHGMRLRGRLSTYFDRPSIPPLRSIRVARVRHGGDWWADPLALTHLSAHLSARTGLGIEEIAAVTADQVRRSGADVLWLTGHEFIPPKAAGRIELEAFAAAGGTLFASACCGRRGFDEAFQEFAVALYGADAWKPVPPDDPIMTGAIAPNMSGSLSNPGTKVTMDGTVPARMDWPILYGVRRGGRWVVIYSPLDVNCGIGGQPCPRCLGYSPIDARTIAANVLIDAASRRATSGKSQLLGTAKLETGDAGE